MKREFPFHIPDSLMEKSTAELNHHALKRHGYPEYDMKRAEEFAHDVEIFAAQKLGPGYTGQPMVPMTRDEMNWEDERDDLSMEKRRITMSRGGVQGQKEDHQQQKLPHGQQELRELADNLPILSTIAYKSPHPVKHTISMTDLIDNDPRLLQKLRMLNKIPLGPHSDEKHLKLLRDDISDIFGMPSQIGDGSCGDDTTSIADSITFATESMDDASSVEASDRQKSFWR